MTAQLKSEFYKLQSTRTVKGIHAAMVGLVAIAALLHGFGLPVAQLTSRGDQRGVFIDVAINLGALFASLIGGLSMTGEIRSGTIRPTLLFTPQRGRVIAAKTVTALIVGLLTGVLAAGVASSVGAIALAGRGLTIALTPGDLAQVLAGAGAAAALWAVVGLGVGAVIRAQVPTIVTLFAWLLFVENLLGDLPNAHRFAPGALAQALAGQQRSGTLHTPALAAVLLVVYAAAAFAIGRTVTIRRDVA